TVLGGANAILFGGGVGENSALIREKILAGMEWLGIELDGGRNSATKGMEGRISTPESQTEIRVIAVDEGAVLAGEAIRVIEERNR
ncbi:MAG TPA: acetate/propionate family kinase, partial [Thiotrichales bacterium]|nr:acetate/propionate family kinase [Thiotrichales bacterium]